VRAYNRYRPPAYAFHMRIVRINVHTGERIAIADNASLFNFPVSVKFLPPERGEPCLVVSSDQEHRFAPLIRHWME
jgi:hypothetical protein